MKRKADMRTWTDITGKFKIEAQFAGLTSGKVKLKKADGTVINVEASKLCDEDRECSRSGLKQNSRSVKSCFHAAMSFCRNRWLACLSQFLCSIKPFSA
jgi:hypothetical protein